MAARVGSGRVDVNVRVAPASSSTLPDRRPEEAYKSMCERADFRGQTMRAAQIWRFLGNQLLRASVLRACRLSQESPYFSTLQSSCCSLLGCLDEKLGNTEGKVLACTIHEEGADPVPSQDMHPGIPRRHCTDALFSDLKGGCHLSSCKQKDKRETELR